MWRLALFLPAILLAACSPPPQHDRIVAASNAEEAPASDPASDAPPRPVDARKLIRTVDLDLRVDDTKAAAREVQALTREISGYVASINANRRQGLLYYQITLKVPVDQLDTTVERIKALAAEVQREHLKTEDVTDRSWISKPACALCTPPRPSFRDCSPNRDRAATKSKTSWRSTAS